MDTYIWYAAGALVVGFLVWWLPQGDKPLVASADRDDSSFDDGGDD